MAPQQNHYAVLALPTPSRSALLSGTSAAALSPRELKAAYRAALLRWHPDKAGMRMGVGMGVVEPGIGKREAGLARDRDAGADADGEGDEMRGEMGKGENRREGKARGPSVDAITAAYRVLSSTEARRAFERGLLARGAVGGSGGEAGWDADPDAGAHVGLEVVDLDDLVWEEGEGGEGVWWRSCRCGEERGFVVRERQLVREEEVGGRELLVGCVGCSLWLRVGFGVVSEGEENGVDGG
jgi:diphthamide biosynthesis protein 4